MHDPKIPLVSWSGLVIGVLLSVTTSCATSPAPKKEHPVVGMAAFDLNCPKEQVSIQVIEREIWGATGCGQRARYIRVCQKVPLNLSIKGDNCHWQRD
jgi:hypothetical protein